MGYRTSWNMDKCLIEVAFPLKQASLDVDPG